MAENGRESMNVGYGKNVRVCLSSE